MSTTIAGCPGAAPGGRLGGTKLRPAAAGPMNAMSMTKAEDPLAADLARDLDGSFERLVREYQDRLFSFACRLTGSREDAEEVAQDAFVRSYRALRSYPADRIRALALKAWLYRITLNLARNRLRGKRPRFVPIEAWPAEDDPASRPDARLSQQRARADLATLVGGLPERYRNAIVLRYVEGLRLDEVATILRQPVGTTKSNLHRAVNALRAAITQSRRARR